MQYLEVPDREKLLPYYYTFWCSPLTTQQSHVIDSSAGLSTLQHCCPCEIGEIWGLEDSRSVAWRGRPTTFDARCSRSVIQICKTCTFQLGNFMLMESNWVCVLRVSISILHVKMVFTTSSNTGGVPWQIQL